MKMLFTLFASFFKVGIMTFGGGIAMFPILEREIVDNKKWATKEELIDYYAVGQCTPGIIAVNAATFIGHKVKGVMGGIFATIGVVFPSVIIILILASFLKSLTSISYVQSAFCAIRVAVCALVISSVLGLIKKGIKDSLGIIIAIMSFLLIVFLDISPVFIVLAAIITGIISNLKKEGK